MLDVTKDQQLVKLARSLERTLAKRRRLARQLTQLDELARETKRFIRQLSTTPADRVAHTAAVKAAATRRARRARSES